MTCDPKDLSSLKFSLDKSLRYHQRRRGFLETVHRAIMFVVVLTGTAAFANIVGQPEILGGLAALLGVIDLTYSPGTRARDHLILHQRISALLAEITTESSPSDQDLREWLAERYRVEADEPPIYWALEKDCWNEICFARGKKDAADLYTLTLAERLFMQVWRFEIATPTPTPTP